ncbi:hypothetical protein QOL99_05045 [Deinococcus sp. MIMF12]|uniref:YvlB/LiaX N-terminal domain-containing protein n=1 Tax=Deinococcus rhizophilus TaxID=3049544 RepID=A0ABT7JEN2_9DEIO|nr:hypothetical protein [Deinococcus rhizophilus]MDL2343514.1 hypothetical protein [Deinococcus rhizophilus]
MREKVRRILDLVRAGKLTLEDAAPLLAALNSRLALAGADRELVASLLSRGELDSAQVAEHLLLLRGVRDLPPPPPPRSPQFSGNWVWDGRGRRGPAGVDVEDIMDSVNAALGGVGEVVGSLVGGSPAHRPSSPATPRILRVEVESSEGDEYAANLPVSLAPHLGKLIPAHGQQALERAGLSVEALQLLLEAAPPPGELINAEDSEGNTVRISLK